MIPLHVTNNRPQKKHPAAMPKTKRKFVNLGYAPFLYTIANYGSDIFFT